jgi:hypothetical protein
MLRVWVQCRFFLPQSFSILLTEYYGLWDIWVVTTIYQWSGIWIKLYFHFILWFLQWSIFF